ncbi:MAG: hypothetical protein R3Y26_01580 [Rikenellaceae bacterium]
MKMNLKKLMSVALLFLMAFMVTGCSKDNNDTLSTQTAEYLISIFTREGILDENGVLSDGEECVCIIANTEEKAISFLEYIVDGTFDTSGEKVTLSDGSSYVEIAKSNTDGIFFNLTFRLNELEEFKAIVATEEYLNSDNTFLFKGYSHCTLL